MHGHIFYCEDAFFLVRYLDVIGITSSHCKKKQPEASCLR